MKSLLTKELKLATSPLTFIFLLFSFLTLVPGYPILMSSFFISFGIFQSYQVVRDNNDILYSALLPTKKSDVVTAKYCVAAVVEICGFLVMSVLTLLRMTVLSSASVYLTNVMMPADFIFLGFTLIIFAEFNCIFLGGFFRTSYYFGKPFIIFITVSMLTIGIGETLSHLPFIPWSNMILQASVLGLGMLLFAGLTYYSMIRSQKRFETTDII